MSNFRRPNHLTTRRMQETRPNPPKEQAKAQRPAREIRWNCPVAAKCGGCQLTRLSYAEQLQWKQQRVAELLDGICEVRPILGMDDPFHYRNKVHAVLAVDKAGKPISGVYAMGTHRVVPVRHCLIEDPVPTASSRPSSRCCLPTSCASTTSTRTAASCAISSSARGM